MTKRRPKARPAARTSARKTVARPAKAKATARMTKPLRPAKGLKPADGKKQPLPPPAQPVVWTKGRNPAGLTAKDLQHFRELLLAKRRELLGDVRSMEDEALTNGPAGNLSNLPDHMADQGTDNYEQEFTLGLMEKDREVLRQIDAALLKTQKGSYGICEGTGKPISRPRLEAQPWARYSIEYARKLETGRR